MRPDKVIERVMRIDFPRLLPTTPIREAVAVLARLQTPAAPVIDNAGVLVGILTEKDCLQVMLNASYYQQWDGVVSQYMTINVRTLPADLDYVSAAEEFLARSHRVYPVVRDGAAVGLLHRSDLFIAILDLA